MKYRADNTLHDFEFHDAEWHFVSYDSESLVVDELRQYRQAASVLRRCQDGGEKIDYKGWKKALDYLNREQFMLDYQLEDMKEEVRRLEIVKREFILD